MEIYEWIVFLTVFSEVNAHNRFAGCMQENTYGYGYLEYFPLSVLPEERPDGSGPQDPKAPFYLEFYVRATQNAHILLAEKKNEAIGLEILLGGGSNTFCQIRRLTSSSRKSMITSRIAKTVSDQEDRGFWIEIDSLDNILVGRKGESQPFLYYHQKLPFAIRYFSFSTWTNVRGVWHFACPKNPTPGLDDEERNVTTTERLRNDLFTYYNPSNFPENEGNPRQAVQVHLEVYSLRLDEKRGEMELTGRANLKWNDWKLTWNPKDYDGINATHVNPYFLWVPKIKVLNSATFEKTSFLIRHGWATVKNDGEVNWRAPFRSVTFCIVGYKKWPYDKHNCTLKIGFSTEPLEINIANVMLTKLVSKWVIRNPEENGTLSYLDDELGIVQFHLERRNPSGIIRNFIVPPFLSAATLILLSFWMNPNSPIRLFFCCGSVFILFVTLVIFGDSLPTVLSSETAGFYHFTVFFYCFPVLFFVGLKYLPDSVLLPRFAADFLNSPMNESLLCFPRPPQMKQRKLSISEERERSNNAFLLSVLYERLIFFFYLISFVMSFIIALVFLETII